MLLARTEHRKATATQTTSLFENSYLALSPRLVASRFDPEGCFVSREWSESRTRLDISLDPSAGPAHLQLLQKNYRKSIHNSVPNKLCHVLRVLAMSLTQSKTQSVPVDVCAQPTSVAHGGHGQHRSNQDGATFGKQKRTQRTRICKHKRIAVFWSLTETEIDNTANSN